MVGRADAPQAGPPYQVPVCTAAPAVGLPLYGLAVVSSRSLERLCLLSAALALALLGGVAGCGNSGATFSASGPCRVDGHQAGAYPELERLVPQKFEDKAPDRLDSGRNCSDANLGTLKGHGVKEVRFAGGLWQLAPATGVTLAVFSADGLQAAWLGEFYETGARAAAKVSNLVVSAPSVAGKPGFRLDYLDAGSPQAIVGWSAGDGLVRVVLTAGVPDRIVQEAIQAFG
jgi:hypothetical protein